MSANTPKVPHPIGDIVLTPGERAALMTGGKRADPHAHAADKPVRYRFAVVAYTPGGFPVVRAEREAGQAALGEPIWVAEDNLPLVLVAGMLARLMWPFLSSPADGQPRPCSDV